MATATKIGNTLFAAIGTFSVVRGQTWIGNFFGANPMHFQIVLFHAWLNLKYPPSATLLGPLIEKLLAEQQNATTEMPPDQQVGYDGRLYRLAFGTRVPPFIRKT